VSKATSHRQGGSRYSRRTFLRSAALTGLAAGSALAYPRLNDSGVANAASPSLTLSVGSFAGVTVDMLRQHAVPLFRKRYPNVTVNLGVRGAVEEYPKLKAFRNRPNESGGMWNDTFAALGSKDGLFAKINEEYVPNYKYALKPFQPKTGLGVAFCIQPFGIAYNPKFVKKPTSWFDLFDSKYSGKVVLISNFWDMYVMVAYGLGKNEYNLEPAVNEWAKYKKNIGRFVDSFTQIEEAIDQGEMWLGPHWGGWATAAQRRGLNIAWAWPKEGATKASALFEVTAGVDAVTSEYTQRFLNEWLSPEVGQAFLSQVGWSPANSQITVPADFANYEGVVTAERLKTHKLVTYDYAYVGQHLPQLQQMINERVR